MNRNGFCFNILGYFKPFAGSRCVEHLLPDARDCRVSWAHIVVDVCSEGHVLRLPSLAHHLLFFFFFFFFQTFGFSDTEEVKYRIATGSVSPLVDDSFVPPPPLEDIISSVINAQLLALYSGLMPVIEY